MEVSTPQKAQRELIHAAVHILRQGGVIAIPTDTLYGLAASVLNEQAVERIFDIKGRSGDMAMPVLLADASDIFRCAIDVSDMAWGLAERFWPGALTIVVKKSERIPNIVTGGKDTVALRVPNHCVPRQIAMELGAPITGTSANRSGKPGLTSAKAVRDEFGSEVDLVIDGGEIPGGLASTVLDLSGDCPRILREGAVAIKDIEEITGKAFAI